MSNSIFWLYADNYRTFNIEVARKLGSIDAALLLAEIAQMSKYFGDQGKLHSDEKNGDGWFFLTLEHLEERTTLSRRQQDRCIDQLIKLNLIEKKVMGLPGKRYFRLNETLINEYFFGKPTLSKTHKVLRSEGTNYIVPKEQIAHIVEEPKEEPIDKRERGRVQARDPHPPPNSGKTEKVKHGSHVSLTSSQYEALCASHGKPLIDDLISRMNDYCAAKNEKYSDYAAAIRNWIRSDKAKSKKERKWLPSSNDEQAKRSIDEAVSRAII